MYNAGFTVVPHVGADIVPPPPGGQLPATASEPGRPRKKGAAAPRVAGPVMRPLRSDGAMLGCESVVLGPAVMGEIRRGWHRLLVPLEATTPILNLHRTGRKTSVHLRPGQVALAVAGSGLQWSVPTPVRAILLWIEPRVLTDFVEGRMHLRLPSGALVDRPVLDDAELCAIACKMAQVMAADPLGAEVILEALASVLMVVLARNHGLPAVDRRTISGGLSDAQLARLDRYVAEHMSERILRQDLARATGTSVSQLARALRQGLGTTPGHYVLNARLREARRRMEDNGASLKMIAADCGFADQAHLSRAFKARYGLPPRAWRQRAATGADVSATAPGA